MTSRIRNHGSELALNPCYNHSVLYGGAIILQVTFLSEVTYPLRVMSQMKLE